MGFQVAVMACGYVPATHQGLVQTINAAAPISGARRALVFIGEQDRTISPAMSTEQSTKFSPQTVTVVRSPTAGHQPPNPSDSAFSTVITFLRGSGAGPPARRPDSPPARRPDSPPAHRPDSPPARRPDSPPARPPAGQTPPGKSSSGGKGSTKKGTNSKKAQEGTKNANRWGSWGSEDEDLVLNTTPRRKILALHGGGMNGAAFRAMMGDYISTLGGSYEFVFPDAPNPAGNGNFNWVIDPPGGKSAATTDPNIAASSTALLNGILRSQGPFYGIFGYSQGAMFTGYYLTQVPANTFQVAVMACGYVPATHQGLVQTINAAAPISGARRALVFIGEQDRTISPAMSTEQSTKFSPQTVTVVRSPTAGHQPPNPSDSAFSTVITFLRGS